MPYWKKQDQCFDEEQIEVIDSYHKRRLIDKDGKPIMKSYPHDKPISQISYEEFLKIIVNPETNEYYPARNKAVLKLKIPVRSTLLIKL